MNNNLKNNSNIISLYKFIQEFCKIRSKIIINDKEYIWNCKIDNIEDDPENISIKYCDQLEDVDDDELDYILKYIGSDGKEHSIPCYINGTGTFDIKEYFKFSNKNIVQKPNRALNTVWATTDNIDKNCKFIIGKETWRYVDEDRISIPGVSYATLNQIGIDEIDDSVSEQLAQKSKLDSIRIVTNYGAGIDEEISINDEFNNLAFYLMKDGKIIKSNFDYEISSNFAIFNEDTNKFELLGDDGSITVTDKITGYS